jgi:ADP-heptose:LPS heptosyltransferase
MSAPRFLVVSLSNVGDAVMTTPVLEALHRFDPTAAVDIVCDRRSGEIFAACPYLGRLVNKDKRGFLRGLPALVAELRAVYYDLVVDLRTDFLPLLLRARRRLYRWRGRPAGPHAVQRHLGVVAALGPAAHDCAPRVWLRDEDRHFAQEALRPLGGGRLLALGPGANWPPKIWPDARFVELIARLRDRFDGVALLGSTADRRRTAAIASGAALPCVDLAGATSLREAAAVLARAQVFVGNDSGLGHIAAAAGTPTLTLFGPGEPERYRPWGPGAHWLAQPGGDITRLGVAEVCAALVAHLDRCTAPAAD